VTSPRLLAWSVFETAGFDAAWVTATDDRLAADGVAIGQRPRPYEVRYRLETGDAWVTNRLFVECRTTRGTRSLDLRRDDRGWTVDGVPRPDLRDALDCDLMACPLTNTMPVRRHALHESLGDVTLAMAFVEVPTLRVVASTQRYTTLAPVARNDAGGIAVIRFRSGRFQSDLEIDRAGFVVTYPKLGRRIDTAVSGSVSSAGAP
jgi:uncharacterized protein